MCSTQRNERFKAKICEYGRLYIKQDIAEDLKSVISLARYPYGTSPVLESYRRLRARY